MTNEIDVATVSLLQKQILGVSQNCTFVKITFVLPHLKGDKMNFKTIEWKNGTPPKYFIIIKHFLPIIYHLKGNFWLSMYWKSIFFCFTSSKTVRSGFKVFYISYLKIIPFRDNKADFANIAFGVVDIISLRSFSKVFFNRRWSLKIALKMMLGGGYSPCST